MLGTTELSWSLLSLWYTCARNSGLGPALRFLCSAFEHLKALPGQWLACPREAGSILHLCVDSRC